MTEYVILANTDAGGSRWQEVATVQASGTRTAIRSYLNGAPEWDTESEQFVAVPARSWHPVTVTAETKTQLRFS